MKLANALAELEEVRFSLVFACIIAFWFDNNSETVLVDC